MLQLYNDNKIRVGTLNGIKELCIEKTLDSGDKTLTFKYPATGSYIDELKTERYIRTKTDEFVIKAIEIGESYNSYTAQMNVEELEGTSFSSGFTSQEQTIRECLEFAFEGTGWSVGLCYITKERTISEDAAISAWDVLQKAISTYRCEIKIDSIKKVINIYESIGEDKGCYFMEELNLRKMQLKADTYDFYTRIVAIGKDGIGLWENGKNYLENYQHSTKIKTFTWKDERYTNTTALKEDAEAKLEEMSKPLKAYTADVMDLAKTNPMYSNILDYDIGDTIQLISKKNKIKEKQRIVKIKEYPLNPRSNTIELSNSTKTFAELQRSETDAAKEEAISVSNATTKKELLNYTDTTDIESKITASATAINLEVKETLKSYYDKTETDAAIELVNGAITLSVSTTYQTKDAMGNYSTTVQTSAAIKVVSDSVELKVTKGNVSSQLSVETGGITLKGDRVSIESTNCTLTKEGYLTVTGATINGNLKTRSGLYYCDVRNGTIYGGWGLSEYSNIAFVHTLDGSPSIRIAGNDGIILASGKLGVATAYDSLTAYLGTSGSLSYIDGLTINISKVYLTEYDITVVSDVTASWSSKTKTFKNGIIVSSL